MVPYQNDYLFASPKLFSALVSCDVRAADEWFAISDHAPIVAEFGRGHHCRSKIRMRSPCFVQMAFRDDSRDARVVSGYHVPRPAFVGVQ